MKKLFAKFIVYILKNIPIHRIRKKFAKFFGPYLEGMVLNTAYGFPMLAYLQDNMNRISFEGSYGVVADFIKDIPSDAIFIDVGANQGCTSILASKVLNKNNKKTGIVLAYEPSKSIYELLLKNIALNKCDNIYTYNKAISAYDTELYLDENNIENSGASHISNVGSKILGGPIKIDQVRNLSYSKNIYVKIDTEGYEMFVLKGIKELFEKKLIRKLVIEISDINLKKYSSNSKEIYSFLNEYDYKPTIGPKEGHYDEVFVEKK
jgi:FkbM family methyltransferase